MKPKTIDQIAETEDLTNMEEQYRRVIMNRSMLIGVEHSGVDYAMFNFILHKHDFKKCNTGMDYIRQFWRVFYPHLKNLYQDWGTVQANFRDLAREQDEILKQYEEAETDKKLAQKYIKDKGMWLNYQEWEESIRERLQIHCSKKVRQDTKFSIPRR
jgi:hypothetical protein